MAQRLEPATLLLTKESLSCVFLAWVAGLIESLCFALPGLGMVLLGLNFMIMKNFPFWMNLQSL